MPQLGPLFGLLFEFPQKTNICKINPFVLPEIEQVYKDWNTYSQKSEKKKGINKFHCNSSNTWLYLNQAAGKVNDYTAIGKQGN